MRKDLFKSYLIYLDKNLNNVSSRMKRNTYKDLFACIDIMVSFEHILQKIDNEIDNDLKKIMIRKNVIQQKLRALFPIQDTDLSIINNTKNVLIMKYNQNDIKETEYFSKIHFLYDELIKLSKTTIYENELNVEDHKKLINYHISMKEKVNELLSEINIIRESNISYHNGYVNVNSIRGIQNNLVEKTIRTGSRRSHRSRRSTIQSLNGTRKKRIPKNRRRVKN